MWVLNFDMINNISIKYIGYYLITVEEVGKIQLVEV